VATAKDIKRRIDSISNTAQITKALQLISTSKMGKAQARALSAIPYSQGLYELVTMLGGLKDTTSEYMREPKAIRTVAIVIIGPSRGFVGGQTTNLTLKIQNLIQEIKKKNPEVNLKAIAMHKVGLKIAQQLNLQVSHYFEEFIENPTPKDISSLKEVLLQGFLSEEYDEVYLAYTHLINTLNQEAITKKLLPVSLDAETQEEKQEVDFIFEPSRAEILDGLLPEYFENQILTGLLDAVASEHSARMVAMQNATDNANQLKEDLNLKFNKKRQSKITEEIIDIISGSKAQVT